QKSGAAEIRSEISKQLGFANAAGHYGLSYAGALKRSDDLPQLAYVNPGKIIHQVLNFSEGFSMMRHGHDVVPSRRASCAKISGNFPLPAMRPSFFTWQNGAASSSLKELTTSDFEH